MVMLVFRGWPAESDSFLVPGHGRLRLKQSNCRQRMADDNVASGRESMEGKGGKVGGRKKQGGKGDKGGGRKEETKRKGDKGGKRKKDETRRERRQRMKEEEGGGWKKRTRRQGRMNGKRERKEEKREDPKRSRPRRVVVPGFGGVGSRKGRAPRSGRTAGAGTTTRHLHLDASHHPPRERQDKRAMMPSWRQLIQSRLTLKTRQQPENA